ncbi:hypothetical protein B0H14DRAFT_2395796 [Mycena olivaceomarginata]|nr:hypothetical protein B0H14DRAFT_2395796 [Mycena olivaceomarginata]
MKFATIIVLASATYTMAGNCSRGLSYCGRSLLHIGNYANQIEAAIQKAHTNPSHMLDTLFYCLGGDNGDIQVVQDCGAGRCADSGPKKSDICLPSSRIHLILEKVDAEESFSVTDQWEEEMW